MVLISEATFLIIFSDTTFIDKRLFARICYFQLYFYIIHLEVISEKQKLIFNLKVDKKKLFGKTSS